MPELHPMLRLCRRLMMWANVAVLHPAPHGPCTIYVDDAENICLRLNMGDGLGEVIYMNTLYLSPEEALTLFGEDFGPPLRVFRAGAAMVGLTDNDLPQGLR